MVDQESRSYRPRRAFIEPQPEPTAPSAGEPAPPAPATVSRPTPPNFDDEDAPKPLYRDEYLPQTLYRNGTAVNGRATPATVVNGAAGATAVNGAAGATATNGTAGATAPNGTAVAPPPAPPRPDANDVGSDDTAIRSFTFAPRTRRNGDETTAILARSGSTARGRHAPSGPSGPDDINDFDEDGEDGRPIGERARWALAIGVIAAVVVLGLAIGYAVLGLGDGQGTAPTPSESAGSVGPAPTTKASEPPPTGGALLTTDMMLTAAQGKSLDSKRNWKEVLTQRGASDDAPVPACFGGEPDPSQPVSQQKILRVLGSDGKNPPSALHDATAYATPEEAAQAFSAASRTLGTCAAAGAWIASGQVVTGLGDQATGAVIAVVDGDTTVAHSVVVSRTGRVLNIVDAGRPDVIAPAAVATALADVLGKQCGPAGGKCGGDAKVRKGPPPLGGDQPGFLAAGDLAPVSDSVAPWNAAPVELPKEDFVGASCENVNWETVAAERRESRVYLHPDSGNAYFGVNQIVLQLKDAKAAEALVDKVESNLDDCKERRLTATVSDPKEVTSSGARNTEVTGFTAVVEQDGTDGSDKFRVGIVRAGTKVAYTFANPKGDFDFTDNQWNTIAVRAGERVTQVN